MHWNNNNKALDAAVHAAEEVGFADWTKANPGQTMEPEERERVRQFIKSLVEKAVKDAGTSIAAMSPDTLWEMAHLTIPPPSWWARESVKN